MKAMLLEKLSNLAGTDTPLEMVDYPKPIPGPKEILIRVNTCGVCHTELDEIEGRTPPRHLPVIPGHQVVGEVADLGSGASRFPVNARVGVGWIFSSCGTCRFCRNGRENLCRNFQATGRDVDGGYAQYMRVHEDFAFPIPGRFTDAQAAPLLCAGAIGYRSLRLAALNDGENLGLTGFGSSAHLVLMLAKHWFPHSPIFVFARSLRERQFAMELGAQWAGDTTDRAPTKLHSIIDTTPAWKPIRGSPCEP